MSERESWEKRVGGPGPGQRSGGGRSQWKSLRGDGNRSRTKLCRRGRGTRQSCGQDFERRLEKAIDRRIRNICLKPLLWPPLSAWWCFDRQSGGGVFFPTPQHVNGMGSASLEEYLGAYYETTRPYVELVPANDQQRRAWTQNRGFGCYTVGLNVLDGKQYWARTGESNVQVTRWTGGALRSKTTRRVLVRGWNAFNRDECRGVRADLEGLPRTSYGYISVRANAPVSIETLRESGLDVNWIEVYSDVESVADQAFGGAAD